jgi:hypothetical protein
MQKKVKFSGRPSFQLRQEDGKIFGQIASRGGRGNEMDTQKSYR